MELKNKIAVVTGGADGLGLAITKLLLQEGATVHVLSRNKKQQAKIAQELNNQRLHLHVLDVSVAEKVTKTIASIGKIDILINNAGLWLEGPLESYSLENINKIIDTNVKGVLYTTWVILPQMLKRNSGWILNVSSTSGLKGREGQSVYAASKFAVTGFTESLALDLENSNVKVLGFYPGGMATQLFAKCGFPKDNAKWMDPTKVAETVLFMLKQSEGMCFGQAVLSRK